MPDHQRVQTIEHTSKRWKLLQLLGVLPMLGGWSVSGSLLVSHVYLGAPAASGHGSVVAIGAVVGFVGLVVWMAGRIGAWWHHG